MTKTLNNLLERYRKSYYPDPKGEQRFYDKHKVKKTADANGNGDDVFKASKIKKLDRHKDRHGYEPGEDAKVYEELESIKASILEYFNELDEEISEENLNTLSEELYNELSEGKKNLDKVNHVYHDDDVETKKFAKEEIINSVFDNYIPETLTIEEAFEVCMESIESRYENIVRNLYDNLSEENKEALINILIDGNINEVLDFALSYKEEE